MPELMQWMSYLAAGMLSGFLAGFFGIGGGVVIVPILILVFTWQAMPAEIITHVAVATSLMTITITSLSSAYSHFKLGTTQWCLVRALTPGLILGGVLGAMIANDLSSRALQVLFAMFLILISVQLWVPQPQQITSRMFKKPVLLVQGLITGVVSAMVGIGGGVLLVPYLVLGKLKTQQAVGTAAVCSFPIAISAVLSYLYLGGHKLELLDSIEWQTGYIHWQAFLGLVTTGVWTAPIGARLSNKMSVKRLNLLFTFLLIIVSGFFLFGNS